jgi:two-component system response regulator NreC
MRVVIVDDHPIVREGLRTLLAAQPDIEVVGEATSGEEAVRRVEATRPDIVLMDITMLGMNGLEATRRIKQRCPEVKILALTMHQHEEYLFAMLEAGVSGYFVKGGSFSELVSALRAISRGEVFLHPIVAGKLLGEYLRRARSPQAAESHGGLTPRQREVLKLVAAGYDSREIAERLRLKPSSIRRHRANIMAKLGLRNRAELVRYAIQRGMVDLDT